MNKLAFTLILAIPVLAIVFSTGGCKKDKTTTTGYIIPIDSIQNADTISVGDILEIKFYGKIGTTSCESFDRFDVNFDQNIIDITAFGIKKDDGNCTAETKYMNGSTLQINSLPIGIFSIVVNEPTGNPIESTIIVF